MGLDITAISKAKLLDNQEEEEPEGDYWDRNITWAGGDFVARRNGLKEGWYQGDQQHRFRAGSYSGYNRWRERLAKFAGWDIETFWNSDVDRTVAMFGELIDFTDCDGFLGAETCERLRDMFSKQRDKFHAVEFHDERDRSVYDDFLKAFTIAADGGMVIFH